MIPGIVASAINPPIPSVSYVGGAGNGTTWFGNGTNLSIDPSDNGGISGDFAVVSFMRDHTDGTDGWLSPSLGWIVGPRANDSARRCESFFRLLDGTANDIFSTIYTGGNDTSYWSGVFRGTDSLAPIATTTFLSAYTNVQPPDVNVPRNNGLVLVIFGEYSDYPATPTTYGNEVKEWSSNPIRWGANMAVFYEQNLSVNPSYVANIGGWGAWNAWLVLSLQPPA